MSVKAGNKIPPVRNPSSTLCKLIADKAGAEAAKAVTTEAQERQATMAGRGSTAWRRGRQRPSRRRGRDEERTDGNG